MRYESFEEIRVLKNLDGCNLELLTKVNIKS